MRRARISGTAVLVALEEEATTSCLGVALDPETPALRAIRKTEGRAGSLVSKQLCWLHEDGTR